jgi:hypothetical protein
MTRIARGKSLSIALALAWLATGCGQTPRSEPTAVEQHKQALQEVGEMYRLYVATAKKAPTKIADFQGSRPLSPLGYQSLTDGDVVVQWGVLLTDTSEEGSKDSADEVLAYEKKVPEQGGEVLMKNRTIKTMTPEQFKSATKASTSDSSAATPAK